MDEELTKEYRPTEVFYWYHNPEALLTCVKVLAWYLGDCKTRWCLPHYTWKMAARLLGLAGQKNKWTAPHWWRKRLKLYGINPETFRIEDERLFGIAWEMLNEYCVEGQPWQISVRSFKDRLKEVEEGKRAWRKAGIVMIPWTGKRRARRENKNIQIKLAAPAKAYSNAMKARIADFKRQFEDP